MDQVSTRLAFRQSVLGKRFQEVLETKLITIGQRDYLKDTLVVNWKTQQNLKCSYSYWMKQLRVGKECYCLVSRF